MKKRFYSFFFCMILISTLLWPAAVFAGGSIGAAEYTVKKNEDGSFMVSFHTPLASGEYWCWAAFSACRLSVLRSRFMAMLALSSLPPALRHGPITKPI